MASRNWRMIEICRQLEIEVSINHVNNALDFFKKLFPLKLSGWPVNINYWNSCFVWGYNYFPFTTKETKAQAYSQNAWRKANFCLLVSMLTNSLNSIHINSSAPLIFSATEIYKRGSNADRRIWSKTDFPPCSTGTSELWVEWTEAMGICQRYSFRERANYNSVVYIIYCSNRNQNYIFSELSF